MRILLVRLSAIGDCLFCSPVVQALRQSFPEAHIGWAVHSHCAPVARGNPYLDVVHEVPRKPLLRNLPHVVQSLRAERYDIAVDMHGLFKSALIMRLSGAKRFFGPDRSLERTQLLYQERVPFDESLHIVPRYLSFAAALGAKWDAEPPMYMPFGEAETRMVREMLGELGLADQRLIAINPATSRAIKDWAPDRFASLADHLVETHGVVPLLTGSPADRDLCDRTLALMRCPSHNLAGRTNLNELAALLSQVELFIGGDTGPLHIAQAAGTKALAIFGPTDPKVLGPRDPRHRTAYLGLECSPCRHRICPIGHPCLVKMDMKMVADIAEEMLSHPIPS